MQTNKILSASLIDLIFDGRNKAYGAYELRKTYDRRVRKSMFITATIVALAITGTVLGNSTKVIDQPHVIITPFDPTIVEQPDPKILKPEVRQTQQATAKQTQRFTEMVIVEDDQVIEAPPAQIDLADAVIDVVTTTGLKDDGVVTTAMLGRGTGIIEPAIEERNDEPLMIVEVEANFFGNWENFIRKNVNAQVPIDNDAPPGRHTVVIQFVVDVEGNISDVRGLTNIGYGMEQEAVRALKKATRWEPAIQNGHKVKAYRRQPITFEVLED